MMLHGRLKGRKSGRVNPVAPVVVALAGFGWSASGHLAIGVGISIGALLAYVNAAMLSRRVDLASMVGNVASALMVMQVGLLLTMTVIGIATIVLIHYSLAAAVASAAGFAVTQMAILLVFYLLRARPQPLVERQTT